MLVAKPENAPVFRNLAEMESISVSIVRNVVRMPHVFPVKTNAFANLAIREMESRVSL